jgi:hypothetical protein
MSQFHTRSFATPGYPGAKRFDAASICVSQCDMVDPSGDYSGPYRLDTYRSHLILTFRIVLDHMEACRAI